MDLNKLKDKFANSVELFEDQSQAVAKIPVEKIHEVLAFVKSDDHFKMNLLMDIVAVDYLTQDPRFELVYILYSIKHKHRLRVKVRVKDGQSVSTVSDLYKSANWAEREVFDMFGIKFNKHPDLKRILMFEGFEGYPLRKDYATNKRQKIPVMKEIP